MNDITPTTPPEWYAALIADVRALAFDGIVATKHAIGKRVLQDLPQLERQGYGEKTVAMLAKDIGMGRTELYSCIRFVRKFPELSGAPDNVSWDHIARKILPEPKPEPTQEADDTNDDEDEDARAEALRKSRGIELASEAISLLLRIRNNDPRRAEGLAMVARWLRRNKHGKVKSNGKEEGTESSTSAT